jgi:hypothetical protein
MGNVEVANSIVRVKALFKTEKYVSRCDNLLILHISSICKRITVDDPKWLQPNRRTNNNEHVWEKEKNLEDKNLLNISNHARRGTLQ